MFAATATEQIVEFNILKRRRIVGTHEVFSYMRYCATPFVTAGSELFNTTVIFLRTRNVYNTKLQFTDTFKRNCLYSTATNSIIRQESYTDHTYALCLEIDKKNLSCFLVQPISTITHVHEYVVML